MLYENNLITFAFIYVTNNMATNIFKSKWKFYTAGIALTGKLKKTKKDCWIEYREWWKHYSSPAKITPKVISETYDDVVEFLKNYLEPTAENPREWYTRELLTTTDYADYTFHSKCYIVIRTPDWLPYADSRDYMPYDTRRRLCLAFFDDVKLKNEEDAAKIVDVTDFSQFKDWNNPNNVSEWVEDVILPF